MIMNILKFSIALQREINDKYKSKNKLIKIQF